MSEKPFDIQMLALEDNVTEQKQFSKPPPFHQSK